MLQLLLYTTSGCHLCEEAEDLLKVLGQHPQLKNRFNWKPVEISESDALIDQYGIRIPVIQLEADQSEIGWPMTMESLGEWIYQKLE